MKCSFFCLLICMLLCLLTTAMAQTDMDILLKGEFSPFDNVRILHRNCMKFTVNGEQCVYVYYELLNCGDNMISINSDKSSITFYDAAGRELYTDTSWISCLPSRDVLAGQRFFMRTIICSKMPSYENAFPVALMNAQEYSLNLVLDSNQWRDDSFAVEFLNVDSTWKKRDRFFLHSLIEGSPFDYEFRINFTNNLGGDIRNAEALYVMRDEAGNPVMIEWGWNFFSHTEKMNAGETRSYTKKIAESRLFKMFQQYNFMPASGEVYVYVQKRDITK